VSRASSGGSPPGRLAKRALDIVAATAIALVTAPLIVATAVAVRLGMGSPILFAQVRAGLHERPFRLLKFRTMLPVPPGPWNPATDAERLTALGRFLRRWSLDELPQLWNVLRGDMSLVGPRPLPLEYLPRYDARQRRRHLVPPGITGWAQVHGRNGAGWPERLELDAWYADHASLALDLRILARTVSVVLRGGGVSAPGEATMREFGRP
jgi:sugar transferase EpsL